MSPRRILSLAVELLVVVLIVSLLAGQVLGQPVLLSYVETGSMSPTMEPGDGFVAVPSSLTGPPERGDVIVFRAEQIQGGGLTTHRVVRETDRGYITRGDGNPFTDQDGDEPPVKDAQIVAEALQVGGTVLVIPNLGTAVVGIQDVVGGVQRWLAIAFGMQSLLGSQGLIYLAFGVTAIAYVLDLLIGSDRTGRERSRSRDDGLSSRLLLAGMALLVVSTATAAMVVPAGPQQFAIISAEFESDRPTTIPQGESSSLDYTVPNTGLVPVYVYLEPGSDGVEIDPRRVYVAGRASAEATMTIHAPPETGYYRRYMVEHRYLALLPGNVVDALYRLHPWTPIVAIDLLLGGSVYLLGRVLVGSGRIRSRSREGPSTLHRLANRLI
ncbi:signal peptidase I [Haloplanus halophilus]|uniref:signal peptidase I n=1 Tax=Haloplanus halophilus TaxID=2949993 RepID=UPI002040183E|nr:signal peptidase I [Haloplanus sp. GDY1]